MIPFGQKTAKRYHDEREILVFRDFMIPFGRKIAKRYHDEREILVFRDFMIPFGRKIAKRYIARYYQRLFLIKFFIELLTVPLVLT